MLPLALALLEGALALVGLATICASIGRGWGRLEAKAKQEWERRMAPGEAKAKVEEERLIVTGKYAGQPYRVLEAEAGYLGQLKKFKNPKPGNEAMQAYYAYVRLHEAAVKAGSKA